MKKATKLSRLAEGMARCIEDTHFGSGELEDYIRDILLTNFCDNADDYPKSMLCDHSVPFNKDCTKCYR